jgi:hypothetical protein
MLSIEECRQILGKPALTDEQVVEIRDSIYCFAHALVDDYVRRRKTLPLKSQ